ncbi:MAG: hypothetical protein ACAH88_10585, partial [Roseimicrobium sp.]
AAVLALAVALAKPAGWRIALAGLLLACANLASGFGFLALIGYGIVAFITWAVRSDLWGALWRTIFLACMVALAWAPWVIRQHTVHGVNNLSTSSANLMYATATEDGRWGTEVASEWQQDGVADDHGARYRYYMEKYREAVKDHPGRYLQTIWRGATTFFKWWEFHGPDHFGVVLIGLIGAAVFLFRQAAPAAAAVSSIAVLLATMALHGLSAAWMWPLATVLVIYTSPAPRRPLWALVSIGIPFVALLTGMTGGSLGRRMWTCCEWGMPLMLVAGGVGAMRLLVAFLERLALRQKHGPAYMPNVAPVVHEKRKRRTTITSRGVTSFATFLGFVLIAHAALASIAAGVLYLSHHGQASTGITIPQELRTQALEAARKNFPALANVAAEDARLYVSICEVGQYVCELDASENQNHWARSFEIRPYTRTVAFVRQLEQPGSGKATLQLRITPDDIPRGTPVLLIGVRNIDPQAHLNHDVEMIEVVGFVPVRVDPMHLTAIADMNKATWLPATPEAERILGIPQP